MTLLASPRITISNSAGVPYPNAKLYTYRAGTLTALATYTDATYGTPHTNPVIANASGEFPAIYINPALGFDLRVIGKDQSDVAISGWDIDNIPRADNSFPASAFSGNVTVTGNVTASGNVRGSVLEVYAAEPRIVLSETDRGVDLKNWDIDLNAGIFKIRTRTDGDAAGRDVLAVTRGSTTAISEIVLGNSSDLAPVKSWGGLATPEYDIGNSGTAFALDCKKSNHFRVTMTGNVPVGGFTITNARDGQTIYLYISQDATGGRTLGWPTTFRWIDGAVGSISSTASRVDRLTIQHRASLGLYYVELDKNFAQATPSTNIYYTGTAATETVPAGVTNVVIECFGASGGGGGGVAGCAGNGGGGGGSGGYCRTSVACTPGQTLTYTVGTKGALGAINTNGGNGTASSVSSGTLVIAAMNAPGGGGGVRGGAGGTGGAAGAIGTGGTAANTTGNAGDPHSADIGGNGGAGATGINIDGLVGGQGGDQGSTGSQGNTGVVLFRYT